LLRISLVEVIDFSTVRIAKLAQQGTHRLIGAIGGSEDLFCPAKLLSMLYQQGCNTLTPTSGSSAKHRNEAEVKEGILYYDVADGFLLLLYNVAVASLDPAPQPLP